MLLIGKAFQSKEEQRFLFWTIFFRFICICVCVLCKWEKVSLVFIKYNTQSRISLEILKQSSLNFAPEMYIAKETKWQLLCRCHNNCYAASPVLITSKIPRFHHKDHPLPTIYRGELRQCGNHVCCEKDPLSYSKRSQMGIFGFSQKETGTKGVSMATV